MTAKKGTKKATKKTKLSGMKVLITGGAGFIGSATARALMDRGDTPILIDNFNDYYDPRIKEDRIKKFLSDYKGQFKLYRGDIRDRAFLEKLFKKERPAKVIHLAAMAGVVLTFFFVI